MRGYRVERRFGWDCHGLPIENIVEKELNITTKSEIERLGVSSFCDYCRNKVMTYAKDWEKYVERSGRWVDMKNDYKTMDKYYMESVWWAFKEIWKKKLIFQGKKNIWICPRCATPLSQIEVNDPAETKEIEDPSIIVKFRVQKLSEKKDTFLIAWTTTPWTIPANVLLAISPKEKYVKVEYRNEVYILAEKRVGDIFKLLNANKKEVKKLEEFFGKKLIGLSYEPVFKGMEVSEKGKMYQIVGADFVSMEEGTGVVHIAPAYGEEDFELGKKEKAGMIQHLSLDGIFNAPAQAKGMWIWNEKSNDLFTNLIKKMGLLFYEGKYKHYYPHCWRCHTKLLPYAMVAWFVKTTKIKKELFRSLKETRWVPEYAKTGRLGEWMKNMKDWCISRNRYWGTPLPVWKCNRCLKVEVIGSIKELEEKSQKEIKDLHRNTIDNLWWKCTKCGGKMERIPEVLDCWFESGSMPYALFHYPFENKLRFNRNFPADFVGEAIEQATKWFYSLLVIGTILFNKAPYKNVVCTGIILAEDGRKMSKHLKNYPDPLNIYEQYGSDALRFFLLSSPVVKGETIRFSESSVREIVNKLFILYLNCYRFLVTYGTLHCWKPSKYQPLIEEKIKEMVISPLKTNILDVWIVLRTADIIKEINGGFEQYDLFKATKPIQQYIDDLSTWYVRRIRRRCLEGDITALETLYYVLYQFTLIAAPFMPFLTEYVWQGLVTQWDKSSESVHLSLIPMLDLKTLEKSKTLMKTWQEVEETMAVARELCSLAHRLRDENNVKVRQPLPRVMIFHPKLIKDKELEKAIKDELNVIELLYGLEPPKDGKWKSIRKNEMFVSLDFEITPELRQEGIKREIVRVIQAARKKAGLQVGEKASVEILVPADIIKEVEKIKESLEKTTNSDIKISEGEKVKAFVV
jgi:isoleucyl-tRNA synthetase